MTRLTTEDLLKGDPEVLNGEKESAAETLKRWSRGEYKSEADRREAVEFLGKHRLPREL